MTTTTPAARLARLLAEGVRILAVQGNDGGIDVTHDIQGLLAELEKLASEGRKVTGFPAASRDGAPTAAA